MALTEGINNSTIITHNFMYKPQYIQYMANNLTVITLALQLLFVPLTSYAAEPSYEVAFSPKQGATELVVKAISEAKRSIKLAAYSFTSKPVAEALVAAHKRGVDVKAVLDKSNKTGKYSSATFLSHMGIPTRINSEYAIMHNKYMVIDEVNVQLGSFNYSKAAEHKNAENVLYVRDNPTLAKSYSKDWQKLWDEAEDYR